MIARMIRDDNGARNHGTAGADADRPRAEREGGAGLRYAAGLFEGLPAGMSDEERRNYWATVEVPYRPSYAYEETLATFGDRPGSLNGLLPYYERIAALITGGEVTTLPPQGGMAAAAHPAAVLPYASRRTRLRSFLTSARKTSCGPSGSRACWRAPRSPCAGSANCRPAPTTRKKPRSSARRWRSCRSRTLTRDGRVPGRTPA